MNAKIHRQPRISINQLIRYVHSTPAQSEKILLEAKYPNTFQISRYQHAREAAQNYLLSNPRDFTMLNHKMDRLRTRLANASGFEKQDLELSLNAINEFALSHNALGLDRFTFASSDHRGKKIKIEGVEVNIRPELLIPPYGKNSKVGALILRPQKGLGTKEFRNETGKTTASLMHYFLSETSEGVEKVDSKSCLVVDMCFGEIRHAPTTYKTRIGNIKAACRQIAGLWENA